MSNTVYCTVPGVYLHEFLCLLRKFYNRRAGSIVLFKVVGLGMAGLDFPLCAEVSRPPQESFAVLL
jgi:hypothetical protein